MTELLAGPGEVDLSATLPRRSPPSVVTGKLGRFTLLGPLASGAMGVVYTAYDDTLDRKVAVKVLHAGPSGSPDAVDSAQTRLLREAQAMARVSHPNVVTVLEAGVANGQVYVAMEFIRGLTLAAWLAAEPRSWQQVLDVFAQAGAGLAAAHAAGLVHRDFKPSNVMIDDLGRARVLDFGLVRAAAPRRPPEISVSTSHSKLDVRLTDDDEIVGTPAYMSPEQWRGLTPEPASDQFSFCVALYEALYGAPPFQYADVTELVQRVVRGQVSEPPRKLGVPTWLAPVVLRGLKNAPRDRYPGMPALLVALTHRRTRGWRRWALAGLVVAAGAAAGAGFWVARVEATEVTCTGAPEELARVWGPARRGTVGAALRAAVPGYAAIVWPRISGALDQYAATWRMTHRNACLKHLSGERSGALLDQQMRCLDQRLRALDETVASLESADVAVTLRALEITGELPALDRCRDLTALAAERPPPDDPELAAQVASLRDRLTRAEVLARSGRLEDAVALATEVVRAAEQVNYAPIHAEALLVRGRVGLNQPVESEERVDWLTRAIAVAFEAQADGIAAEAMALRLYALARQPELIGRALADEPLALALARRSATPEVLRGLVLNNLGTVQLARQNPAEARRYFTEALAVREAALGSEHRDVGYTLMNLALASESGPERERLLARALSIIELELGPAHPETLEVRLTAAHLVGPVAGSALVRPGCVALDRFLTDDVVRRSRCLLYLGRLAIEIGDDEEADASFLAAAGLAARAAAASVPLTRFEVAAIAGYAALVLREHDEAIDTLEATLAALPQAWWSEVDAAELRLVLGQNQLAAGRVAAARASLEASVAEYTELAAADPQLAPALARARRSLADALLALEPMDAATARHEIAKALGFYRSAGAGFARQLARTEGLEVRASAAAAPGRTTK